MPAKTALHVIAKKPGSLGHKDKHREQRKKIIKMCVQKLREIDDPETVLCRAVLINNTFKMLKYTQRHRMPIKKSELKRHSVESVDDDRESSESEPKQGRIEERDDDASRTETYESTDDSLSEDTSYRHRTSDDSELEFENNSNSNIDEIHCDINDAFSAESIVHSLVMPPLLSPQLEDMTNCSFYDNFAQDPPTVRAEEHQAPDSSHITLSQNEPKERYSDESDMLSSSLKLTLMKTNLCDVISESNSNNYPENTFDFSSKVELSGCSGVVGDIGNSLMIDNLLTEIVQV